MSKQDTLTKILVVDDDQEIVNLFNEFLTINEYSVTTAGSANEAINTCRNELFDAVLLDINMPRASGITALNTILEETPNQVVIMISAIHDVDMVVQCIKTGAYDFIVKPIVDLSQIPLRIDHAIENAAIKKENVQLKRDLNEAPRGRAIGVSHLNFNYLKNLPFFKLFRFYLGAEPRGILFD